MLEKVTLPKRISGLGYRYLLISLSILLLFYPILANLIERVLLLDLMILLALVCGVAAVSKWSSQLYCSLFLVIAVFVIRRLATIAGIGMMSNLAVFLSFLLFAYLAILVVRDVAVKRKEISPDLIYGAVCGYLLMGIAFAFAYMFLQSLDPSSFTDGKWVSEAGHSLSGFIYFSFVTLSTLGYGDILPQTLEAGSLAYSEAILGQFYLAVLVARLVGLSLSPAEQKSK